MRPSRDGSGVASGSVGNQGHGIYSNGRNFNYDNRDQEVNDTNIDPVSPFANGGLEEGVSHR